MKKDKLFDLIHDFIYYYGSELDRPELWESVDWFLEKIAEKYGED